MKDVEIRLELAKAALSACSRMSKDELSESIKNLYEWVVENKERDVYEDAREKPSGDIVSYIRRNDSSNMPYASKTDAIFRYEEIDTVGKLLEMGRHRFRAINGVGGGTLRRIDDALFGLYGIQSW